MPKAKVIPTLFTPFTKDGDVDYEALRTSMRFYQEAGVAGIFANCQTSEAIRMSEEECLEVIACLAECKGDLILYGGLNRGDTIEEQAELLKRVHERGADVPVIWLSLLPEDSNLDEQVLKLADLVGVELGIYESPDPVHRLLSDEELTKVAKSGKIGFFKDTCRDNDVYARRMSLVKDTKLESYQANWMCYPQSLKDGSAGFCGWVAAPLPAVIQAYSNDEGLSEANKSTLHQAVFELQEAMRNANYPASGKYLVSQQGYPMEAVQRSSEGGVTHILEDQKPALDEALATVHELFESVLH